MLSTVVCPTLMPTSTGAPVVVICATESAAWSWDTTVASVGALTTLIVAVWALVVTLRGNRLERERRTRDDRAALSSVVGEYLEAWAPVGEPQEPEAFARRSVKLHADAAGISEEAHDVARWVIRALDEADREDLVVRTKAPTTPGHLAHPPRAIFRIAVQVQARARVTEWVASGRLDQRPLFGTHGGEEVM